MSSVVTDVTDQPEKAIAEPKFSVVFLRKKLKTCNDDRYFVDMARAAQLAGHKVTIYTSEFSEHDCLEEVNPASGCVEVRKAAYWIPQTFQLLRSFIMTMKLILFPPKPLPKIIIVDNDILSAFLLSKFSKYKLIFINHFRQLKYLDLFSKFIKVTPDLMTAMMMHSPHEIVVQSEDICRIFRRSYPRVTQEVQVLTPCVDTGAWKENTINVKRIIPDLASHSSMFLCCGPYLRRSNFKLALDAFEHLLLITDEELRKDLHLVIAGNCSDGDISQQIYYKELIQIVRDKNYGNQVTFLKQLPTVHKKTLINESIAVLHTIKYDIYGDTILAAMALKTPIIGTDTGFTKGVITHRISAILVEGNSMKFAAAMYKLLTSPTIQRFVSDMANDVFSKDFTNAQFNSKVQSMLRRIGDEEKVSDKE